MSTPEPGTVAISAVLITKNAATYLPQVLASVALCDEILVVDSGSTDDTLGIARAAGARIEHQDFLGFGEQKRAAVALAKHDWIFSIDGDEILDAQGRQALAALAPEHQDPRHSWRIRRRNLVGAQEIRFGDWAPDRPLRLFNRQHSNFAPVPIHEAVVPAGPVHLLDGCLWHYSYRDLADVFRLDYHRLKGQRYRQRGRRASGAALFVRALGAFLRSYLIRQGWRDGQAGVIVALSVALNASLGLALASSSPATNGAAANICE